MLIIQINVFDIELFGIVPHIISGQVLLPFLIQNDSGNLALGNIEGIKIFIKLLAMRSVCVQRLHCHIRMLVHGLEVICDIRHYLHIPGQSEQDYACEDAVGDELCPE